MQAEQSSAQLVVKYRSIGLLQRSNSNYCRIFGKKILMANTYIRIYLHIIFAVKNRNALIAPQWRPRVHSYISESLRQRGHLPIAIGGTSDHVHLLISFSGKETLPELVRDIKTATTHFINDYRLSLFKFEWQKGYGCFSYSHSQINNVANYIMRQEEHHKCFSLRDEIKRVLDNFGIEYDEQYIFDDLE